VKPLRLQMSAFGPYGGTETIEFERLEGHKLFLICGPTGAGKTSILDAMTYALYGESSSLGRDAGHFRSHHAEPTAPTEVELDFAVGKIKYRVWRRAGWQRPKKRGPGVTDERPVAELRRWKDDKLETVADKLGDVLREVHQLMGMSASEFRQIILLPQGEFRRLLAAKPSDRETILQTLFRTSLYGRIAEVLKKAAKKAKKELEAFSKRRQGVLEGANTDSEETIEATIAAERDTIERSEQEVGTRERAAADARNALEAGRQAQGKLDEHRAATTALDQLLGRADQIEARAATLARARDAGTVAPVVSRCQELERGLAEAEEELRVATRELDEWRTRETEATNARRAAEEKEPERTALEARVHELETLEPARDRLQELHAELDKARAASALAASELDDLKVRLEVYQSKHRTTEADHKDAHQRGIDADRLQHERNQLHGSVERAQQHGQYRSQMDEQSAALAEARGRVAATRAQLDETRDHAKTLESDWLTGQAAVLARGLSPSEPCPVCGSTEHPAPAPDHADVPDDARLETARAASTQAEEELQRHQAAESKLHGEVEATRGRVDTLAAELGEDIDAEGWRARLAETKTALDAAESARAEADRLAAELTQLGADIQTHHSAVEHAGTRHTDAETMHAAAGVRVQESEARVPEHLRTGEALEREHDQVQARAKQLTQELDQARERAEAAAKKHAAAVASSERAERRVRRDREVTDEARARVDEALVGSGFTDRTAWRAATLTPEQINALQAEVREFGEHVAAAKDRLTRAQAESSELEAPDIPNLETVATDANNALAAAHKEHAAAATRLAQLQHAHDTLRSLAEETREQEIRWQLVAELAHVAAGKNPRKLSFQRYVLAGLFDDVLFAASEQLKVMSRGRYLLRQDDSFKKGGQQGGLNLVVDDAYTGTDRPVSTLSGGEGFLAALSLALGLSDVVQSYSGGTFLDALFIDEGFGSLDPEALDLAIRALTDLQAGGRLVGIISHVPELRERVPARLEVEPGPGGSSTRFEIA